MNADTQLVFTVSLSQPSTETTTVAYATTDRTATLADNDYVATSGTLTFAPGQTTALVTVTSKGDTKFEVDETFNLVLSTPSANARLLTGTAIGSIINDDGLSGCRGLVPETNADTQLIFTVSRRKRRRCQRWWHTPPRTAPPPSQMATRPRPAGP